MKPRGIKNVRPRVHPSSKSPADNEEGKQSQMAKLFQRFLNLVFKTRQKSTQTERLQNRHEKRDKDYQIAELTWKEWRMGRQEQNRMSNMLYGYNLNVNEGVSFPALPFRRFALVEEMENHIWTQPNISIRQCRKEIVVKELLKGYQVLWNEGHVVYNDSLICTYDFVILNLKK